MEARRKTPCEGRGIGCCEAFAPKRTTPSRACLRAPVTGGVCRARNPRLVATPDPGPQAPDRARPRGTRPLAHGAIALRSICDRAVTIWIREDRHLAGALSREAA
ncbi:hypothetical protein A7982_13476 [Minicystis rosea]|nr:hypothetical protein A7982_13476 [Minicystis rosea]